MALPLVQTTKKSVNGVSSSTKAFDSDVTVGGLLLVGSAVFISPGTSFPIITIPTDSRGNTYYPCRTANELIFNTSGFAFREHMNLFYAIAKDSGPCTVTFGQTGSTGTYHTAILAEFSPVHGVPAMTGETGAVDDTGTSAAASAGSVMLDAGLLVIGFCTNALPTGTATFTEGGSFININKETDVTNNQPCAMEYFVTTSQASLDAAYTTDTTHWGMQSVAFLPLTESDAAGWTAPTLSDAGITTGPVSVIGYADIRPTALYDAAAGVSGKTIVPCLTGVNSDLSIATYDHDSAAWDTPQIAIDTTTVSDGHQAPAIILGGDGKYHIFWGSHLTGLLYVRSTNAHDPTAWTDLGSIVTPTTYPNIWLAANGHLMLFYRAGGHTDDWVRQVSTDNGGTWGSAVAVLDATAADVYYLSAQQSGDTVHVIVTWEDEADAFGTTPLIPLYVNRYGLYYFRINTIGGSETYTASDGTSLTLPITKTDLDAHCVVRSPVATLVDVEPRLTIGLDGYPAMLTVRGMYTHHVVSFMKYNGSTWSSPVTVCASGVDHSNDTGMVVNTATNTWYAYVVRRGTSGVVGDIENTGDLDVGGNVDEYLSTDDGATWVRQGVVSTRTRMNNLAVVENGIAPVQFLAADWVTAGAATAHIFGFVPGSTAGPAPPAYTATYRRRAKPPRRSLPIPLLR